MTERGIPVLFVILITLSTAIGAWEPFAGAGTFTSRVTTAATVVALFYLLRRNRRPERGATATPR